MSVTAEYDREADALYVRVAPGERVSTTEVDERSYLDRDTDGRVIGLELLYPSLGLDLDPALVAAGIEPLREAVTAAIVLSGAPTLPPSFTAGALLASTFTMTVFAEGTVGAEVRPPVTSHSAGTPGPPIQFCQV